MTECVLFRVAAGPRIGFGHLVRSQRLARAIGMPAVVAIDASAGTRARKAASVLGCRVVSGTPARVLRSLKPSLLVVDHPTPKAGTPWIREARTLGIPTASIHDLGIAPCDSDCSVDGTVAPGPMDLAGVDYAIIDPALRRVRRRVTRQRGAGLYGPPVVLIAFGGGHRLRLARAVATRIVQQHPDAHVRIACGFGTTAGSPLDERITLVPQQPTLADEYRRATIAILGGGVSLYEACVVGVPAIGVSIVQAQRPTIAGLSRRGAVVDGGAAASAGAASRIATAAARLLNDAVRRQALTQTSTRLVDGRGVDRVAARLRRLARGARG